MIVSYKVSRTKKLFSTQSKIGVFVLIDYSTVSWILIETVRGWNNFIYSSDVRPITPVYEGIAVLAYGFNPGKTFKDYSKDLWWPWAVFPLNLSMSGHGAQNSIWRRFFRFRISNLGHFLKFSLLYMLSTIFKQIQAECLGAGQWSHSSVKPWPP